MVKIAIQIAKNTAPNEKPKMLSFEKSSGFQYFMKQCSDKLGIGAKRAYKEDGTEITDLFSIDNNDLIYLSQGEEFMAKKLRINSMSTDNMGEMASDPLSRSLSSYKILIVGSGPVGKSAIALRYTKKKFISDFAPTIEDEHKTRIEIDSKLREISIVDTSRSEQFLAPGSYWMTKREAFVLVFSIDSPNSFSELGKFFDHLEMVYPKRQRPIVLVANKLDLPRTKHLITEDKIKAKAEKWKVPYFAVSAKNDTNIVEVFEYIVREIDKNRKPEPTIGSGKRRDYCTLI